ncbi:D-alanyl-D-alanine carboxypeptidase/D-alanyl-D-alanine-endopeptidase [Antrihabitans sp. YC2-6]|uniref:D-alanyl-D-alanine carboxypeptidase/D-alanyl-D-alanine endopeptidase n=1 Tax=Antrihabitans sp. YC2-6 TaxID=2799498 RepID=UPI0018F447F3|nr:D-alanyl-D-alanine carboxypeptidase/D-alanyl-D-alanine-endopeptidase [Antrihabitans sp. YC2-6]MBJ8344148.1 D-alanyl-D-alanine carboxypeptidase/D-alanyl-D-alanine-endopeptidase [Antrihabitans sp. YC2-6]
MKIIAAGVAALMTVAVAGCGSDSSSQPDPLVIPDDILAIMDGPRYQNSTWSLVVRDVETDEIFYELNADRMSLTGSTRKLFSVGLALDALGADHRIATPVRRVGEVDPAGALQGDLVLVGSGDLTFGGRRVDANTVQYTDFDHNDANALGSAILTPQDPLYALDELARQVAASGIRSVNGNVVVDDQLFDPYRVPNGNLLITPIIVNESMIDVTVTPAETGQPAVVEYRPRTAAFTVGGQVNTAEPAVVSLSGNGRIECIGAPGCAGEVSGTLPVGYKAPLTQSGSFVGTFRVEDPASFARIAFIEALQRHGVTVSAPMLTTNPAELASSDGTQVASYESAPFAQQANLVLKVSLNLGANLSLSLFGLTQGARTIESALAAERETLTTEFGIDGAQFDFPTNGSGTPDSRATPHAIVGLLDKMADTPVAEQFRSALPVLGENGSLATSGRDLPGRGNVFAKPGTTLMPGADGETIELKAQNLAGYIETKSGRTVAYALMLNDGGTVTDIAADVGAVFEDEARISSLIYEKL